MSVLVRLELDQTLINSIETLSRVPCVGEFVNIATFGDVQVSRVTHNAPDQYTRLNGIPDGYIVANLLVTHPSITK
jgi:hypothetical protein